MLKKPSLHFAHVNVLQLVIYTIFLFFVKLVKAAPQEQELLCITSTNVVLTTCGPLAL